MGDTPPDRFRQLRDVYLDSPFLADIGARLGDLAEGEAEVSIDLTDRLRNRNGTAHGGVIASLVDSAMGQAIRTHLEPGCAAATVEMKINYVLPGTGGTLRARGRALKVGGVLGTALAEVFDADGQLLAVATGTYRIFRGGRPRPAGSAGGGRPAPRGPTR